MELKDWLNSINFNKENLLEDPAAAKDYPPYIVNRCLSGHLDCIMFVNEMNKYSFLDKDMQYSFYLNPKDGDHGHIEYNWIPPLQKTQRYRDIVYPILLQSLDAPIKELFRIRAVMNIRGQISDKGYPPHTDLSVPHFTMLYYVNDADGPTKLYDGDKVVAEVEPKKGRVLFMDGNVLHAGSSTTTNRRMIINFNFSL